MKAGDSLRVDFIPPDAVDAIVRTSFDPTVGAAKVWIENDQIKYEVLSWQAMMVDGDDQLPSAAAP